MKHKIDTNKLLNVGLTALVSSACGALGSYAMNRTLKTVDQKTKNIADSKKRPIGFDMKGE